MTFVSKESIEGTDEWCKKKAAEEACLLLNGTLTGSGVLDTLLRENEDYTLMKKFIECNQEQYDEWLKQYQRNR